MAEGGDSGHDQHPEFLGVTRKGKLRMKKSNASRGSAPLGEGEGGQNWGVQAFRLEQPVKKFRRTALLFVKEGKGTTCPTAQGGGRGRLGTDLYATPHPPRLR